MSKVQVKVKQRDPKKKPRTLVREEIIPGVVYDQKTNSQSIEIPLGELERFLLDAKQGQLIEISIDGEKPKTAIFKEIQIDVRKNSPKHISFMLLNDNERVDMPVRISLEGEAPAVKNSLGVMIQTLNSIDLRGFPKDFPNNLTIDVSSLENVGDSLDMTAITIPNGLEFIREDEKELPVVTIRPFQKAIEEEKPVVAEGEELAEGEEIPEGEEAPEGEEGETGEGETPEGQPQTDETPREE